MRDAAPDPSETRNYYRLAGDQNIGRAQNPINGVLPSAIQVIELLLERRVVERDYRAGQRLVALHRAQAHDTGGSLLDSNEIQRLIVFRDEGDQVRSVIEDDLGPRRRNRAHIRVVALPVLTVVREGRDRIEGGQRGANFIARTKRIGSAQRERCARGLEASRQRASLGS